MATNKQKRNRTIAILSIAIILAVGIFGFDFFGVVDVTCSVDSGFDHCNANAWKEKAGSCTAVANPEVQVSDIKSDGEIRQASSVFYFVTGESYIEWKVKETDTGAIFDDRKSWDEVGNNINCDESGCSISSETEKITNAERETKKYQLTSSKGEIYSGNPKFIAYEHSFDEFKEEPTTEEDLSDDFTGELVETNPRQCNAWAFSWTGWGYEDTQYDDLVVRQVPCLANEPKCGGEDNKEYLTCETPTSTTREINNQGKVVGKCGVECTSDSDCSSESNLVCTDGDVHEVTEAGNCQNNFCTTQTTSKLAQSCEFGCENGQCKDDPRETFYRFLEGENKCVTLNIKPNESTSDDYKSKDECKSNLDFGTCGKDDTCYTYNSDLNVCQKIDESLATESNYKELSACVDNEASISTDFENEESQTTSSVSSSTSEESGPSTSEESGPSTSDQTKTFNPNTGISQDTEQESPTEQSTEQEDDSEGTGLVAGSKESQGISTLGIIGIASLAVIAFIIYRRFRK